MIIDFIESKDSNTIFGPAASECLVETKYYDAMFLAPFFTTHGEIINPNYKGIKFHLISHPVALEYLDFRLNDENKYELLTIGGVNESWRKENFTYEIEDDGLGGKKVSGSNIDLFIGAVGPDDELSSDEWTVETCKLIIDDDPENYLRTGFKGSIRIGAPLWCQSHYWAPSTKTPSDEEWGKKDLTDYENPLFQDEEGNKLESVMENIDLDVFGSYYLFYSTKTRLIRQFFQCT